MFHFKKYFIVYKRIIILNFKKAIIYRTNFFLGLLDSIVWFGISLIFFESIYLHSNTIEGWSIYETLFLVGIGELLKTFLFVFLIDNLTVIPSLVNEGTFDRYLLLPVSSRFMASLQNIDIGNIGSFPLSLALIIYSLSHIPHITFLGMVLFIVSIPISFLLLYSLWMNVICLSFWLKRLTGISELFISTITFMRYPAPIFKGILKIIFLLVFPVVVASNIPATILLDKTNWCIGISVLCVFTFIHFTVSSLIWKVAMKQYESVGG